MVALLIIGIIKVKLNCNKCVYATTNLYPSDPISSKLM